MAGLCGLLVIVILGLLVKMGLRMGLMRFMMGLMPVMGMAFGGLFDRRLADGRLAHHIGGMLDLMFRSGVSLGRLLGLIPDMRLAVGVDFGLGMGRVGLAVILYGAFCAVMVSLDGLAIDFSLARNALVTTIAALGALIAATTAGAARGPFLLVFLGMGAGLIIEQRLPVSDGNLVIIRMDFRKGEESVTVSAVIDEGGLERRLHPRHLRQIDIAAKLFLGRGFEVEFFYAVPAQHHNPGLLRVGCVDKHFVGHLKLFEPEPASPSRLSCGTEPRPVLLEGGEAAKGARAMSGEGIRISSPARRLSAPGRELARFWMKAAGPLEHVINVIEGSALETSRMSRRAALCAGRCVCA